jgi:hypothetical protein
VACVYSFQFVVRNRPLLSSRLCYLVEETLKTARCGQHE